MRAYVGSITHETNAFSPIPTSLADYSDEVIGYGDILDAGVRAGFDLVEGLCVRAAPSAPTKKSDYERLRDQLLGEIQTAGALDCVLLSLHGAQVAEGYSDCEGDVVAAVRKLVGEGVIIGVLLDLHANISETLLRETDLVTVIKEYPHTDFPDTAQQLVKLAQRLYRKEVKPVTAFVPVPVYSLWHTPQLPAKALVDKARILEQSTGVLHVSLVHGFPWSDVSDAGASVIVISDNDSDLAAEIAASFAGQLWDIRSADLGHYASMSACFDAARLAGQGPVVIADAGDNPGAGTGSDATWLLHEVLQRGLKDVAFALLWDPASLKRIVAVGVGATVALELGAHTGALAGRPLVAEFEVLTINTKAKIDAMPGYPAIEVGTLAAVSINGVQVVVGAYREQVFGPRVFTEVGIDPVAQKVLVVKSAQHFYKAFAPLASKILYCDSPCSRTIDFHQLPFQNRRSPMWPLDDCSVFDIPTPEIFS